ncbi:DNA-binding protein SMUBP-2 [Condylostylus longicornis]|uniref:DNA-binding protein SMUBP-2 n=1 Tax=Condylostylus longicornis TaxID=2530218 RepID=UPI00244DD427|nr:DNA-binding protein SMUBP-2 [Condylostylus longicornis]
MDLKKNDGKTSLNDNGRDQTLNSIGIPKYKKPNALRNKYGNTNKSIDLIEKLPNKIIETKLNDVVQEVKIIDSTCDFNKCKTKTNLMGQDCLLCKQRYCFKHNLPEVHGCGSAVKRDEREKFLHPKPLKTIRQEQELKDAKKRLNSKLKDMSITRLPKK